MLATMGRDRQGAPNLATDGDEERILALLALAYDRPIGAAVLGNIRRASNNWANGEPVLAAIDLALGGLSPLADVEAAALRLSLGEKLLAEGLPPRDLLKGCGLDPTPLDALKAGYNPLEPRIPAGNGRGSGDWTTTDNTAIALPVSGKPEVKPATPAPAAVPYTPVHGLPDDAVVVTTPAGKTIPDPESKTKKLMAPPRADFHKVFMAGTAISMVPILSQIPAIRAAVGQGEVYDFQRDPTTGLF
ncbi:MAG TPA: hypothetical protein VFQ82_08425, partial [Stellaceae bacterium]|nr:hypothetical protein [Stellaceae bacterium]